MPATYPVARGTVLPVAAWLLAAVFALAALAPRAALARQQAGDDLEQKLLSAPDSPTRVVVATELFKSGEWERLRKILVAGEASDEVKKDIIGALKAVTTTEPDRAPADVCRTLWPSATGSDAELAERAIEGLRLVEDSHLYEHVREQVVAKKGNRREVEVAIRLLEGKGRRATTLLVDALPRYEGTDVGAQILERLRRLTGVKHASAEQWRAWLDEWKDRSDEEWLVAKTRALEAEVAAHRARVLAEWRERVRLLEEAYRADPKNRPVVDQLLATLQSGVKDAEYPAIQREAVRELGKLAATEGLVAGREAAVATLLGLLPGADRGLGRLAIEALGGAREKSKRGEIVRALLPIAQRKGEDDVDLSIAAIAALGELGEAEQAVRPLHDELAAIPVGRHDPRALPLVEALGKIGADPDGMVSTLLCERVTAAGAGAAATDENRLLQAMVVALGQLAYEVGGERAARVVDTLGPIARSAAASERLRFRAVTALGRVPHERSLALLMEVVEKEQTPTVKSTAISAVGTVGAQVAGEDDLPGLFATLAAHLNGGDPDLRVKADAAVKHILNADTGSFAAHEALAEALAKAGLESAALEYLRKLPESADKLDSEQSKHVLRYLHLKLRLAELLAGSGLWRDAKEVAAAFQAGLEEDSARAMPDKAAKIAVARLIEAQALVGLEDPLGAAAALISVAPALPASHHDRLWTTTIAVARRLTDEQRATFDALKSAVLAVEGAAAQKELQAALEAPGGGKEPPPAEQPRPGGAPPEGGGAGKQGS